MLDLVENINYCNTAEHVPEAVRSTHVIQEHTRATFRRLPRQSLPKTVLKVLIGESTKYLNYFPYKGGVSHHRIILPSKMECLPYLPVK